ncbi:MAG: S41 family peptidase [Gammaproteobacteria bacterium]
MNIRARQAILLTLTALLVMIAGCGGSSGGSIAQPANCTVVGQNQFVIDVMQDIYLWNDELPQISASDYASPTATLEALKVAQDRFSYITSTAADDAFFGQGQVVGLIGFSSASRVPGEQRITDVFEGSPADAGGLVRGDRITAVDGRPIAEVLADEGFSASLGPNEVGVTVELSWQNVAGEEFTDVFEKAVVTIPPVSAVEVLDTVTGPIGYLLFRNFVEPAVADLDAAFATLGAAGVDELVVDLRYNGGGLLSVSEVLANLIGGEITQNQVQYSLEYNANNSFRNQTVLFRDRLRALDLQRVFFIVTGASASASELVINALRPYLQVVLIGADTFGKPVGQLGYNFCEKTLRPISFRLTNAQGESDYFDGFVPDCPANDDLDRLLGDPAEASLSEVLHFLENGRCSVPAAASMKAAPEPSEDSAPGAWRLYQAD